MKKKRGLKNSPKIEEILQSWDAVERAHQPDAFFYTKVQRQIIASEKYSVWQGVALFFSKPVIAFGFVVLLVMINISVAWKIGSDHSLTDAAKESEIEVSATDAGVSIHSFYDTNNY